MSEDEILALRRQKLERLRERGIDPYPPRADRTHSAADAVALLGDGEAMDEVISVAGRLTAFRNMGKAAFGDLRDGSGRIQAYFKKESLGVEPYETLLHDIDLGDFIGVSGRMFRTRTGEATIEAQAVTVLAKALRPPPEKWHGLHDIEARYRQRYLDLMSNPEVRGIFETRSRVISAMRRFMEGRGYLEVETPILQSHAGGAAARPFKTYHNTLERELYLRIALELHLKRLVVGGFDRVFEIGRIFRNEGVGTKWNPEFTMMESYEAYADYNQLMDMVETLVSSVAGEVLGSTRVTYGETEIDLTPPWPRTPLRDAILEGTGVDFFAHEDRDGLAEAARGIGIKVDPAWGKGKIIDELLTLIEPGLMQPVFLTDYPVELSPLAKRKPDNPGLVERFEFFIAGREIGNAYTELNDPIDQRDRLIEQARLKAAGDDEVEVADEEFLIALEHGMPPTAGLGIGIDRLVMALTNSQSIRDVILFPALRDPK